MSAFRIPAANCAYAPPTTSPERNSNRKRGDREQPDLPEVEPGHLPARRADRLEYPDLLDLLLP